MSDLHQKTKVVFQLLCCAAAIGYLLVSTRESVAQEPTTRWEEPVVLFDAAEAARVFNPLVLEDTEGGIKVLWETTTGSSSDPGGLANGIYCVNGDGANWSEAIDVIAAPGGGRTSWPQHAMDAYGRLHLVWIGPNAQLYYSRVPSAAACDTRSWETKAIPISDQVLYGEIFVDESDTLHVAYAARAKDIYYTRSVDDGRTWTEGVAISAVQPTVATSFPSLTVDRDGRIHIVWEQNQLPDGVPSLGLFYASSQDDGISWSAPAPFSQADGEYTQPVVTALMDGSLHLLWNGRVSTRGRYHQWSTDGGATWSAINEFVPKDLGGGQTGPPGIAMDGTGTLHVATGTDGTTYAAWQNNGWLPAYDIASFGTFGNMEDQNVGVARGRELYVVANASLRRIILIRGLTDAPETAPSFRTLEAQTPRPVQATATPVSESESPLSLSATPSSAQPAGSPTQASSVTPILLSSGLAFAVVAAVVAATLRRKRP